MTLHQLTSLLLTHSQPSKKAHWRKREDALQRRKRRITADTTGGEDTALHLNNIRPNPSDEFLEGEPWEDLDDLGDLTSTATESARSRGSGSTEPTVPPLAKADKHVIASAKLKQVKNKANSVWREHLNSSARVSQLIGTVPEILDDSNRDNGPPRFKAHSTHRTMAIRSIVCCKLCGYWAAKKSQKLQQHCLRKPPHADGAYKSTRMLQGLHPEAKVNEWPDGHDARIPSLPILVDWNSR